MTLLELPSGMSLEYATAEQSDLRARLALIGPVSVTDHVTFHEVTVGDESFIQVSDWDEPCLIAQSVGGNTILRRVFEAGSADTSIAAE